MPAHPTMSSLSLETKVMTGTYFREQNIENWPIVSFQLQWGDVNILMRQSEEERRHQLGKRLCEIWNLPSIEVQFPL